MLDLPSTFETRRVLLDADGVLLNWFGGFADYASRTLGVALDVSALRTYSMRHWLGEHAHRAQELIETFNASAAHGFDRLEALPGAVEAVSALKGAGYELHVITSCTDDPAVMELRERNLRDLFGDAFATITCLPMMADKYAALAEHPPSIWIDDHWPNLDAGRAAGHHAVLFHASYNEARACVGPTDYPRLPDWPSLLRLLDLAPGEVEPGA
jgi:HAD superfamily hydrolase (TIGR01509 family)